MKWSKYNILFYSNKLGYCLFNTRMLSFSKIGEKTYQLFTDIRDNKTDAQSSLNRNDYEKLIRTKVLVSEHEDENFLNMLKYKKDIEAYQNKILGIVVCPTLSCNFACPYCYEHNLPKNFMKEEIQNQFIDFLKNHSDGKDGMTLSWHGGEPLIAFETIKQIYDKIDHNVNLPIVHSTMVSNGYLLNETICKYLSERNLDYLQITIDGNKGTHDKTRKLKNGGSSFERIIENIDMATELMPKCRIGIRTNIGKGNRDEYVQLYKELSSRWKGKNISIYHSYVLDNSLRTNEKKRFAIELSTEEKNDFEINLAQNGIISKKRLYPRLSCGTHTCTDCNAYVIDPEGCLYKCWADVGIKERSIGTLSTDVKDFNIVSQFMVATDKFSDEKCLKCSYLPVCHGGCNLYRVGKIEKGIPYNVCSINNEGLIKYLETYMECV